MAQSHILGKGGVLGDRQDTTGRLDPVIGYDHGTIMQRAVLKEYILDQAGIYIGVEHLARMLQVKLPFFSSRTCCWAVWHCSFM